jgi:arginyl-tRNA synthetase
MQNIQNIITGTIKSLYSLDFSPEISPAPKPELGEYCVNIFPIVKQVGKAPPMISEELANELAKNTEIFKSTSATGGYVNFFLTDKVWMEIFQWLENLKTWKLENSQTIIVDYIGANVGKPLHIGHICTPSIGQVICNVYNHLGYRVIGDSHFCDWGGIFGKIIAAGKEDNTNNIYHFLEKIDTQWVSYLLALYQNATRIIELQKTEWKNEFDNQCREEFKKLSNGDKESVILWEKITNISIWEIEEKLELINVKVTYNIGESFYEWLWLPRPNNEDYPELEYNMKSVVKELIEKWVATQNEDGSVGVVFPEESKLPSCILQKKDGTGLYLTSDLAAIKYRLTNGWNPSKIVYSVDVRQQLHLKQAFNIAKMAWWEELGADNVEFTHISNGFIKLKEGAMSTRHGTVIFLEALIDEGNERTRKILEEKWRVDDKALNPEDIQAITIAAIKYSYLAQDREKDVTFDWDKALNFEGNSGPYIQYAYVRAKKIEWQMTNNKWQSKLLSDISYQLSVHDKSLIQTLSRFDEVVEMVAKTYKPHHLALYAYDLAVTFNSFYVHTPKILEEKDESLKAFRLALVSKTAETLEKSFDLLGIKMPSEM